jgi:peroxiredoxin Q/BCP
MPDSKTVELARKVPDFSAAATSGDFRLSQLRGQMVVLYFYPKDNTPGCTTESQEFAAASARFAKAGATIVGVSRDSLSSHEKFRAKYELPFALLSDPDEALCTLFGVMKQKNMYGKMVRGIERSTFLIDAQGVLRQEWRGVKIPGHVDAVLDAVKALA